jgi:hypothetical protein
MGVDAGCVVRPNEVHFICGISGIGALIWRALTLFELSLRALNGVNRVNYLKKTCLRMEAGDCLLPALHSDDAEVPLWADIPFLPSD